MTEKGIYFVRALSAVNDRYYFMGNNGKWLDTTAVSELREYKTMNGAKRFVLKQYLSNVRKYDVVFVPYGQHYNIVYLEKEAKVVFTKEMNK